MKKAILSAASILFVSAVTASAQTTLVQFTAENITTSAVSTAGQPITVGPFAAEVNNLSNSGTAQVTGYHSGATFPTSTTTFSTPGGQNSTKSLSSNNWSVGDYYQFVLSNTLTTVPAASFGVSVAVLGSNTGPSTFNFQYSTDNVNYTTFGTYSVTTNYVTQTFLLGNIPSVYNNANTVYFRLTDATTNSINNTTVAAGGTSRFDNFTVGTVPEPATTAYLLAGIAGLALVIRRRRLA